MPTTERTSFERSGAGQHLGARLGSVFSLCRGAQDDRLVDEVGHRLQGFHARFAFYPEFDGYRCRHQSGVPVAADRVVHSLSAEPLRSLKATRNAVGAHLFGDLDALREELALQLHRYVFAELTSMRRAVSDHAEKLLNSFTNSAVCGVGDFVFHGRHCHTGG